VKDSRDGQTYKTVKIGSQTWMAENLNFKTKHSYCYDNDYSNCTKFGQFYDWVEVTEVCPKDWNWQNGNGSDDYGFSALPAGSVKGYKGFYVYMVAKYNYAVYLSNYGKLDVKKSVRCIMDGERLETR
jgi:hypothetical protein